MTAEDGVQTIAQFIGSSAGFLSLLAELILKILLIIATIKLIKWFDKPRT